MEMMFWSAGDIFGAQRKWYFKEKGEQKFASLSFGQFMLPSACGREIRMEQSQHRKCAVLVPQIIKQTRSRRRM